MNTKNLFFADPYNDNHVKLFNEFEESNKIKNNITSYLNEIRTLYSKEKYQKLLNEQNETYEIVFSLENDKIKDSCYIRKERDRKICELYFAPLNTTKNRQLLTDVSNYVLDRLGMEQIFVSISPLDKNLQLNLEAKGFENIGTVNGDLTFIKENKKEVRRVR